MKHGKSPDSIVFECELSEPPETVWRALTQPEVLAQWLMPEDGPSSGRSIPIDCEILAAEPNRFLRYRWRETERARPGEQCETVDSIVTFELSVIPTGGTHLRVVHSDFVIVAFLQPEQAVVSGNTLMSGAARARTRSSSRRYARGVVMRRAA